MDRKICKQEGQIGKKMFRRAKVLEVGKEEMRCSGNDSFCTVLVEKYIEQAS